MGRATRLFEIIRLLKRASRPLTASDIARLLEVSTRTVYRDFVSLQAMKVPVEGEAGIGYIMREGYELPPLMFTPDEVDAIMVGLSLLGRTGDAGLSAAAANVRQKIDDMLAERLGGRLDRADLHVSRWHAVPASIIDVSLLRKAIRRETKLSLAYEDAEASRTERVVWPIALVYYVESVILVAWCELRSDFRHFRTDRISECSLLDETFRGQRERLHAEWQSRNPWSSIG
ncbi:MAG: hypothetical protein RLZZ444_4402 [Pseudomonadota bacterium]